MARRERDYAAEYRRRIQLNVQERGLTRKQARGQHLGEGRLMPNGQRARILSVSEVKQGRLAVGTIETMHAVNTGLNGAQGARWEVFARSLGWSVYESKNGRLSTTDDIADEILRRLTHRQQQYFFGY